MLGERQLIGIGQLGAALPHVKHVDGLVGLRRNQYQIDLAPETRQRPADSIEQAGDIVSDDLQNRVAMRGVVVEVQERQRGPWPLPVLLAFRQASGNVDLSSYDILEQLIEFLRIKRVTAVGELEDIQRKPTAAGQRLAAQDVGAQRGQYAADVREQVRLVERH